jgi:hypothetical protein
LIDARRVTLVPPGHWLLIEDNAPFRAGLRSQGESTTTIHVQSIAAGHRHIACFAPRNSAAEAELHLERYAATSQKVSAIRFLARRTEPRQPSTSNHQRSALVLLTNGIGGMARLCVDLGPREFQIRLRARREFESNRSGGPPHFRQARPRLGECRWFSLAARFQKSRVVQRRFIRQSGILWRTPATAARLRSNCAPKCSKAKTRRFSISADRPKNPRTENNCPPGADVRLTVRCDIEDRNFHSETKRNGGADFHFSSNTHGKFSKSKKKLRL